MLKLCISFIFASIICTTPSVASVKHGTYFSLYLSDDFLVVAIDSRRISDNSPMPFDDQCKIVPLSKTAIFMARGIISSDDPVANFNGFSMSSAAYRQVSDGNLQQAAAHWADGIINYLRRLYPLHRRVFYEQHNGEVSVGYFLGVDYNNDLTGYVSTIRLMSVDGTMTSDIARIPKPSITLGGHQAEVTEFFAAATPRAVDINNRINTEAVGKSEPEREMMKMAAIVETVPRWANDTTVGGDIAQVIFDKTSNGWRWFHRPSFCPEN